MSNDPLLEIRNLKKHFEQNHSLVDTLLRREKESVHAVDGVSLTLNENESQAVIGESGCGKSTLLFTIVGIHDITDGEIYFKGDDVASFDKQQWKEYRKNVQVIFQDPFNSLDPKLTVRETLREPLEIHGMDEKERRVEDILEAVELQPVEQYIDSLPQELSGGEKQRVSIARALILEPKVILADEPVSMLDVSTQAALLRTLRKLVDDYDISLLYISHDLSTVSYVSEKINVMYLGRIVEAAETSELVDDPKHPYSQALVSAVPIPDPHHQRERTELAGSPKDPIDLGEGCRFRDRCPEAMDVCEITPNRIQSDGHEVTCHLYYDHEEEATQDADEKTHITNPSVDGGT